MDLSLLNGGGVVPVNSFIDLYEFEPVVERDGATYFRTGYVSNAVENYPLATKMSWLYPPADGTTFASAQTSQIEYRFSRWIIARSYASGGGQFQIGSSTDYTNWADNATATLTVQATSAPTLVWDSVGSALCCYVANHANRFKTTNGTAWTPEAINGLAGHVIDVIRLPSIWVALTSAGIFSSTDGLNWTQRQAWAANAVTDAGKLAVDESNNIMAMLSGMSVYYRSANGTSWTSQNCPANHTATGHVAFGNSKWQTAFKNTIRNVTVAAIANNITTWTLGETAGVAGRWNSELSVWLGDPRGGSQNPQMYSKDGLNWITTANSIQSVGGWTVVGNKTYGMRVNSNITYNSASHLGNAVGLPYSLGSVTINANKYLRVK
ncbi:hypothetical protein [Rheinheimera texasensis]|uniref:hypothetical protein n=1 Tax=Rheinheimera texasensis TaxID=306205 RepID=UPI0032B25FDA